MSLKERFLEALRFYPIIPSLRREEAFSRVLASRACVVLISSGTIFNLEEYSRELRRHGKLVLVHVDLIGGLGRDQTAVRFLKEKAQVHGIVTPNSQLIITGRKEGLLTVHRLFAHDSPSIETGIRVLKQSKPDFIEVLPGVALAQVVGYLREHFQQPLIAAGLVKTVEDVRKILQAGAVAVDTSAENLWNLNISEKEF
ncbi:MAG: Putative glycerol-3-phosphate responsive antiterminator [Thermoanaerobacterales bacterium 50_218]|nr:MAG: Putative glycerol-3-phosphate responsive antiterminator [Thermoanaerobacterales bacterium 50_218]